MPETRTILAALTLARQEYGFIEVDLLRGENMGEPFLQINPLGSLPTLKAGDHLVLGGFKIQL